MMRDFHMTLDQARDELPMTQAFALAAFAQEFNPHGPVERDTDGYIAQEIARRRI